MVSFRDVQSTLDVPDLRALLPQSSTSRGATASDYSVTLPMESFRER